MSKDNLDKFFQQKANQRSFEFKDDYWADMELLLEDEGDKKTPVPFWWQNGRLLLGSLIAIIAIGALYMLLKQSPKQSNSTNADIITQNQNGKNSNNTIKNISTLNTNNSNGSDENINSTNSNDTENTNINNSKNTLNNNSSNTNTTTTSASRSSNDSYKNNPNKGNRTRSTINSNQKNSSDRNNRSNNTNTSNNDNSNPTGLATKNTTSNKNDNNKSANSNTQNTSGSLSDKGSDVNNQSGNEDETGSALNRNAEKTLSEDTKFNFLDLIDLSEIDDILNALKTKLPKPTKEDKTDPPSHNDFIAIGVQVGASRYFYDSDFQNEQPYSPTAGVYATFPIANNLSLSTGLNYWARGNINAALSEDSTVYNFGFQRITTTDLVSRATYLEIPLSLKYRIREKHIAEIGGNFSYLLTARGSRSVTMSDDFGTTDLFYNVSNGYKNWLNTFDASLRLGYHYQWNERGTIGLQWQYGLTDITPNDIYNSTNFDRNHQFKIRFAYDLIRIERNKK